MKYYLYIILTLKNTLYCGIARNPIERFEVHKNGLGAKYLRTYKPKSIVYLDVFSDKSAALKEEYRIKKTLSRKDKLKLIEQGKKRTLEILGTFL